MSDLVHLFVVSVEGSSLCSKVIGLSSRLRRNRERWRLFTIATDYEPSTNHNSHLKGRQSYPLHQPHTQTTFSSSHVAWVHGYHCAGGFQPKGDWEMGTRQLALSGWYPPLKLASWLGSFHLEKEPGCIQKYSSRSYLVRTSSRDFGCGSSSLWKIFM